jgi:hypothetical protein
LILPAAGVAEEGNLPIRRQYAEGTGFTAGEASRAQARIDLDTPLLRPRQSIFRAGGYARSFLALPAELYLSRLGLILGIPDHRLLNVDFIKMLYRADYLAYFTSDA